MFYKLRYFRKTKDVKLTEREKGWMRSELQAFMKAHPVRVIAESRQIDQEGHSHFLSSFKSMMLKPLPITLSALLVLGGGTAFAAEQSLPNEALYPVKVQVNERVRATFTPTTEAKAKWEARVAVRRLEEAEELAIKNKLNAETQTTVETNFDAQAKLVQEKIARLKAEGNTQAAIDLSNEFQASLRAHETILVELDAQNIDETVIDPMIDKVKLNVTAMQEEGGRLQQEQAELTVDTQAELKLMAQKKKHSASEAIATAKHSLNASTNLNTDIKAKATLLIQMANTDLTAGNDAYNKANSKLALTMYGRAEVQAGEAIILLKASHSLRLEALPEIPPPTDVIEKPTEPMESEIQETTDLKLDMKKEVPPTMIDNKTEVKIGL